MNLYIFVNFEKNSLELKNFKIKPKLNSEITFYEENNKRIIKVKGQSDIDVGNSVFNKIKDATIVIDKNGKVLVAEFSAGEDSSVVINGDYRFNLKKGGSVKFNLENGLIEIKGGEFSWDQYRLKSDSTIVSLDKNGNIIKISAEGSVEFMTGTLSGAKIISKNSLDIFFNENIKNNPRNAISIDENYKIKLKGDLQYKGFYKESFDSKESITISYQGLSKDSYSEYNGEFNIYFDVQKGPALIDNNKHRILVKENGEALLGLNKDYKGDNPVNFKVTSYFNVEKTDSEVSEGGGKYIVTSYPPGQEPKVNVIELSIYDSKLKEEYSKAKNDYLASLDSIKDPAQREALKLRAENQISLENGNFQEAIDRAQKLVDSENEQMKKIGRA